MGPRAVLSGTLHVHEDFRRQGVAQRLLAEAEAQARLWGMSEMLLLVKYSNKKAQRLYQKVGYVALKRTKDHRDEVCMRKRLFLPTPSNLAKLLPMRTVVKTEKKKWAVA